MSSSLPSSTPSLSASTQPSNLSTPAPGTPASPASSAICTRQHALYCFDVLVAHFQKRDPMPPPFDNANESFALFATWNTTQGRRASGKPALRGCIGNFSPMPLAKGLREYALVSALEDHRFSPVREDEIPYLSCSVSLLTPFIPIPDPLSWTPGEHGIHLTFPSPTSNSRRTLSATYLPEICPEQGWTKEETVISAIHKAGYRGKVVVGDDIWNSLKVKVYGSVKAGCTYSEYTRFIQAE
ncbi:AMMECR1 domain-containing protein [Naematelia encephala]|uniref:AMMECR1 domain-containing protein n=1 Tax=Naematelia encephala TaxID=71784 RepID=A0A1Y2AJ41_9TREE|nr:AMMECR1 domain-containing protein [Naematelia encephala]